MSRSFRIISLLVFLPGIYLLGTAWHERALAHSEFERQVAAAKQTAEQIQAEAILYFETRVPQGRDFADCLQKAGLDRATSFRITQAAAGMDVLRRIRAGNRLGIGRSVTGELRAVRYQMEPERELLIALRGGAFRAETRAIPVTSQVAGVTGEISDSLFNAVTDAGERAELAIGLADIFGWDLDFYTDPRRGDSFRVAIEKKLYANGRVAAYGRILAAEYVNDGRTYQAVLFRDPAGKPAYYAPDGNSLQKAFLRSPLKFSATVSSHFSRSRFHPILKHHRSHLGTDYAAPTGTPVQTIGDGRIVFAGVKGGSGKTVEIRHTNGYATSYLHLSRILVHAGEHVSQGQRIGLVGSTGLATGSHLDFRIQQHGAYRNFESLRLPPAHPVAQSDWNDFVFVRDRAIASLPEERRVASGGS